MTSNCTLFIDFVRRLLFQKQYVSETGYVLRSSLFGDVTQRGFIVSCRRFERTVLGLFKPTLSWWMPEITHGPLLYVRWNEGGGISYSVGSDETAVHNLWSTYSVSETLWWMWNAGGWTKSIKQVFWRVNILFWSVCVPYNCASSYASTVTWKRNSFSVKKVINSLKNFSHCSEREGHLGKTDGSLTCTCLSFKREIALWK